MTLKHEIENEIDAAVTSQSRSLDSFEKSWLSAWVSTISNPKLLLFTQPASKLSGTVWRRAGKGDLATTSL